jgi:hypothetical protein
MFVPEFRLELLKNIRKYKRLEADELSMNFVDYNVRMVYGETEKQIQDVFGFIRNVVRLFYQFIYYSCSTKLSDVNVLGDASRERSESYGPGKGTLNKPYPDSAF